MLIIAKKHLQIKFADNLRVYIMRKKHNEVKEKRF